MTTTMNHVTITAAEAGHPELSPERFARAVWTMIAEPGDTATGELIHHLGAEEALRIVLETDETEINNTDVQLIRERTLPRYSPAGVLAGFRAAQRVDAVLITPEDPHWPSGLNDLGPIAPIALWARGNTALLAGDRITALVGARACTGYGERIAMDFASGLVDRGHTIVTGAGYGIEGAAHRATLASSGKCVAILAGGVDRFYPSGHEALLDRIVEAGVVVSELSCGQSPTKWRFIMRNRLIAAMAEATIVVEAGWRSGSLNVAGHAAGLDRPLGAVPGPITSAASAGCHRLIRDYSATTITTVEEADAL